MSQNLSAGFAFESLVECQMQIFFMRDDFNDCGVE